MWCLCSVAWLWELFWKPNLPNNSVSHWVLLNKSLFVLEWLEHVVFCSWCTKRYSYRNPNFLPGFCTWQTEWGGWGWSRKQKGCFQDFSGLGRFLPRKPFLNRWVVKERTLEARKWSQRQKLNSVLNGSGSDEERDWGWAERSVAKEVEGVEQGGRCSSRQPQVLLIFVVYWSLRIR